MDLPKLIKNIHIFSQSWNFILEWFSILNSLRVELYSALDNIHNKEETIQKQSNVAMPGKCIIDIWSLEVPTTFIYAVGALKHFSEVASASIGSFP